MKIVQQTLECGPGGTVLPGAVRDVDDELAKHMIKHRYATPHRAETAALRPPENAAATPTAEQTARENLARIAAAQGAAEAEFTPEQKLVGEEAFRLALDGGATEEEAEAARTRAIADFLA